MLDWLRQFGFTYNPFQERNSERDGNLSDHFIEPPDFDALLEVTNQAIFARTGDGKTATRLRLQSFYRDALADKRVFAFSYLISQELADATPTAFQQHINEILTSAVRHLFILLTLRGVNLPALQEEQSAVPLAQHLAAFFDQYYGVVDAWRMDLRQALFDHSLHQAISNLAPVYDDLESQANSESINSVWLQRWLQWLEIAADQPTIRLPATPLQRWRHFCDLLDQIGIRQILILVDGVDVKPDSPFLPQTEKSNHTTRMVAITRPLLEACHNRRLGGNVAWKLFLPLELYLPFLPLLQKQIFHVIVAWDDKRLRKLLEFRLAAATGGVVSTLLQLAEEDVPVDLETYLLVQCGLSPRYLTHLINKILEAHVMQGNSAGLPGKLSSSSLAQIAYLSHSPT
ncbi:MAG: hypothetical protein DYG89_33550 [Caldilinea sp. CFX5]|nr:hypothetical protein [Caldilinea sp. CFX5]